MTRGDRRGGTSKEATDVPNPGRERQAAEERALERYLRNHAKTLGTLVPPLPDAPPPDVAVLRSFLAQQLASGISNEAVVLKRRRGDSTAAGSAADGTSRAGQGDDTEAAAKRGVVIAQPQPYAASGRTVPLALPWPASPGPGGPRGPSPAVYLFWDLESAHPGDLDPRLAAAEVMRLASRLGRVASAAAYASRPAWAWVPSRFVAEYGSRTTATGAAAASGGGGAAAAAGAKGRRGVAASGGGAGEEIGVEAEGKDARSRPRCPVCGAAVVPARLEAHIRTLHPDRPAAELAAKAVAAAVASGSGGNGAAADSGAGGAAAAGPRRGARGTRVNTAQTGLGAVREYYSSTGQLYRPPAGHQISLKYAVQREGLEPRVAQNADAASDRAVNGGIDRLMAALRNGRAREQGLDGGLAEVEDGAEGFLVLVSGSSRHGPALEGCSRLGLRTVLVGLGPGLGEEDDEEEEWARGGRGQGGQASGRPDVRLRWELLAKGAYQL
ncbi:hypothetical protein HYH03_003120 [Edaphochlamys debaryana]|uniref:C2H2-type domain-containing protein n=1 Tax=Edaphochlamys debaryana TaxID=47281 RepID=A0A835Y9Q0_9CHLO|nr:hypothetical protein HYH03_003120 [Edaphochlamys debaryana]|eukprot:KAG2498930.1 hypothetical protein HYH03_003120 [Edaphochlamys debaryana]